MPKTAERFILEIAPTAKHCRIPPILRLRRALKALGRHGLRCVSCKAIPGDIDVDPKKNG